MAGRLYVAPLDAISVTTDADQDIWELGTASTKQAILHGFSLTATTATDERLRLQLIRRTATGSGGSTATSVTMDQGNGVSAASTLKTLQTTPGTGTTILMGWTWGQQGELLFLPTPETRPVMSVSSFLALHLQTAAGGTRTWSGWVAFEEI